MKESTGSVAAIYIVIFFIVIMFGFILSTLSYYKSYKINNSLSAAIDDYGGFNAKSKEEIEKRLTSYGYSRSDVACKKRNKARRIAIATDGTLNVLDKDDSENQNAEKIMSSELGTNGYCVYLVDDSKDDSYTYYSYKVATYMTLDFGIVDFKIPYQITSNTTTMYSCYGINCDKMEEGEL